jgi:hypothetical protein
MKNAARFITLQNPVQFIKDFGLEDDWKDMTFGDFIKSDIPDLTIDNFDNAIRIVKHSNIKNVQLRQDDKINGGTIEWDNF